MSRRTENKARDLVGQVLDDPYILTGGCSFNRYIERIAQALEQEREKAIEECALIADRRAELPDHHASCFTAGMVAKEIRALGAKVSHE